MVGVTATTHRRFAYEKQRHHPSRSRSWRASYRRSRGRHRRRRSGTEFHDKHDNPVHSQHGEHPVDDSAIEHHHGAVNDDTEDAGSAAGIQRSPVSEHGQQVRLGRKLGF